MTEPAGRVTQTSDPELWQSLHDQWEAERRPGWVVRHAGGYSWKVVQLTNGDIAFDPQDHVKLYESTSFST